MPPAGGAPGLLCLAFNQDATCAPLRARSCASLRAALFVAPRDRRLFIDAADVR
jgi:hypothetical protein